MNRPILCALLLILLCPTLTRVGDAAVPDAPPLFTFVQMSDPHMTADGKRTKKPGGDLAKRLETAISEICRREGIASSVYYKWSKAFLEAGKNGLTRAVLRDATVDEVKQLKQENAELKISLAEAILDVQRYKKSLGL